MTSRKTITCLFSLLAVISLAARMDAAVITWGPATTVATVSDIDTSGKLVEAVNLHSVTGLGSSTANGVTFTDVATLLNNNSTLDLFDQTTGDAGYDQILSDFDFGNGTGFPTPVELTLGGGNLIPGNSYLIQVWYSDTRADGRNMQYGDGEGNFVSLTSSDTGAEFAIGTFTADGINQTLALRTSNLGNVHFNAYQIRLLTVPEPSTALLFGLGGWLVYAARRRTRRTPA